MAWWALRLGCPTPHTSKEGQCVHLSLQHPKALFHHMQQFSSAHKLLGLGSRVLTVALDWLKHGMMSGPHRRAA